MTAASSSQAPGFPGSEVPDPEVRYLITPNRSMNRRQALWFVVGVAGVSFVIAGGLALGYGAWPILPFAGMEVALLAFVIRKVQAQADHREWLVLDAANLDVTCRHGRDVHSHRFNRHWVRVNLRKSTVRHFPSRLRIGSHGKFVEIGAFLTEDERESLANNLTARLSGTAVYETFRKSTGEPRQ